MRERDFGKNENDRKLRREGVKRRRKELVK